MRIYLISILLIIFNLIYTQELQIENGCQFVIENNPTINLTNMDFINYGIFYSDSSLFLFEGNSIVNIFGVDTIEFFQININKSDQYLQLKQNIAVKDSLWMTNGIIELNYHDIFLDSTGWILNENEQNYITGISGGEIVSQQHYGIANAVNPGNLGAIISSNQVLGDVEIRRGHTESTLPNGNSIHRYYTINSQNNINLAASLQFHYFDHELNTINEYDLDMWRFDGSVWTRQNVNYSPAERDTVNDYLVKSGIPSFSKWTLGPSSSILPVELIYFDVRCKNGERTAYWSTATEINCDYYEIRQSEDAMQWEKANVISGSGNSTIVQDYVLSLPNSPSNYFQLIQYDFNGASDTFQIVYSNCNLEQSNIELSIYPNPSQHFITIQYHSIQEIKEFIITNIQGKQLLQFKVYPNDISSIIDISDWSNGVYYLKELGSQQFYKIIKQ